MAVSISSVRFEGLKKEGIPERVVEKIFYGNAVRFFSENL